MTAHKTRLNLHSVNPLTFVSTETAKRRITQTMPRDSPGTLPTSFLVPKTEAPNAGGVR